MHSSLSKRASAFRQHFRRMTEFDVGRQPTRDSERQFDLGNVPIEDRVVLEVLAPSGERLCKFHLDLL